MQVLELENPDLALLEARTRANGWFYAPLQQAAFEACLSKFPWRLPCFAYDNELLREQQNRGSKQYVCTSYERLYKRCVGQPPEERRWYEILYDDFWCNGYVDLDLCTRTNPRHDGTALCRDLKALLCRFAAESYPSCVRLRADADERLDGELSDDVRFVEMTSSGGDKFSRHLIVHFRDAAFLNLKHFGAFMRRFHRWLLEREGPPEANRFYVWRHGAKIPESSANREQFGRELAQRLHRDYLCVLDMNIYTMHRAFRCYGQHKFGEGDPQRRKLWLLDEVEARCEADPMSEAGAVLRREVFLDAMIQHFEHAPRYVLTCLEWDGSEPRSTSNALEHIYPGGCGGSAAAATAEGGGALNPLRRSVSAPAPTASGGDLEPELVAFFRQEFENCYVAAPQFVRDSGTLTLATRSHSCRIANREHRSNHVYVVVNAHRGAWCQKCHGCGRELATQPQALPPRLAALCQEFVQQDRARTRIDLTTAFSWL